MPVKQQPGTCPVCGEQLIQPARGRKRKTCSSSCRQKLWRHMHPRCQVCRKHFTKAKFQQQHKYCSPSCKDRAYRLRQRQRTIAQRIAATAHIRPEHLPHPGSGYREEIIPWEADEQAAVVRARPPQPNYEPEFTGGFVEKRPTAAELKAAKEQEQEEELQKIREERKARRLAYDLLIDESKWFDW